MENAQRLLERHENGQEPAPLRKGEVTTKNKRPRRGFYPKRLYPRGVCSGCHKELVQKDGRTFHMIGVSTDCPYGTPDYKEELDYANHSTVVTFGGKSYSTSFFSMDRTPKPDPSTLEINVPEWCFFDYELVV